MSHTERFTAGWTAPIDYQLLRVDPVTGVEGAFDATGATVSLVLKDKSGTAVDTAGDIEWLDETTSKVRYNPDATDLDAAGSPYTVKFKVVDVASKVSFYPAGEPIIWRVYAP